MKEIYFGSLVWGNKTYNVFTDKPLIRFKSLQQVSEETTYESTGKFRLGITGVLRKAKFNKILEVNPNLEQLLGLLGFEKIDDLCRLSYSPGYLDQIVDKDDIGIEGCTYASTGAKAESRKLFFIKPFSFRGNLYAGIEFKGCGKEGETIKTESFRRIGNTTMDTGPEGGLYSIEAEREAKNQGELNKRGKINPLQIAAFELPIKVTSPYSGEQQLGLLVRGVKSSFRLSELVDTIDDVITALNISGREYIEEITTNVLKDLKIIFEAGYVHGSPNDSNVDGSGNITDLGDLSSLESANQIYYNLLNFTRVADSLCYNVKEGYNKRYAFDKLIEIFGINKTYNLKEISREIYRKISSK